MLNKDQYDILGFLYNETEVCIFKNHSPIIHSLINLSQSLIDCALIEGKTTIQGETLDTFSITEKGKKEWENYLEREESKRLKIETLNISKKANKLSLAAIIVSCIAALISAVGIIVNYFA